MKKDIHIIFVLIMLKNFKINALIQGYSHYTNTHYTDTQKNPITPTKRIFNFSHYTDTHYTDTFVLASIPVTPTTCHDAT
jgi:hypothetical protein